jgi:hypothetical protein
MEESEIRRTGEVCARLGIRLDRGEAEPQTPASETSDHSSESSEAGTF